jgi:predicted Zn-dependent protease
MNRRDFLSFAGCSCCCFFLDSCSTAPITGRSQFTILPESFINKQSLAAYKEVKKKSKLITEPEKLDPIVRVGTRIEKAIAYYFQSKQIKDPTQNYEWEFILIDEPKILNAWCMPGGKIAVYSGILEITKDDNGLAAVLGHEISHAVAKHSLERASQAMTLGIGSMAADIATGGAISRVNNTVGQVTGMDILQLGILNPFSRVQESEADHLGIIFSSLSGYDPNGAIEVWQRMQEKMKGKEIPQYMSTHPSSETRIHDLRAWLPYVKLQYPKISDL